MSARASDSTFFYVDIVRVMKLFTYLLTYLLEEVILQLIQSKCIPVLIYGLEVFAINSSDLKSLDFTVNRFCMKLFRTSNINIITDCQLMFNFVLPSAQIATRTHKFLANLSCVDLS